MMPSKQMGDAATEAERALEATLGRVPGWVDRAPRYHPVGGGITNSNFKVTMAGAGPAFFIKIPGRGTDAFIDRRAANQAARNAHAAGLGPRVHHFFEDTGVEIAEFLEGMRSCNNLQFQDRSIRDMAIDCYQRFHGGAPLGLTKTVFDMIDEHVAQARGMGCAFPPDFAWLDWQCRLARGALEASGLDLVACFNDPMPMNLMLDAGASRMLMIDYEYASNNDRCYDLGIWFGEMFFTEAVEFELIERYFGRVDPAIVARCQLHKALADIKWGCWSIVQEKASALEFDYAKYGGWKFTRARSVMHDPRWERWLHSLWSYAGIWVTP
jgi:thiamine kinase-like enzyme